MSTRSLKSSYEGLLEQQVVVSGTPLAGDKSNEVGSMNAYSLLPFSVSFEKVLCTCFSTTPKNPQITCFQITKFMYSGRKEVKLRSVTKYMEILFNTPSSGSPRITNHL